MEAILLLGSTASVWKSGTHLSCGAARLLQLLGIY